MTQDDVIRMADHTGAVHYWHLSKLEAFAKLVAAHEREACAKVCDDLTPFGYNLELQRVTADDCAAAIRARGEQA